MFVACVACIQKSGFGVTCWRSAAVVVYRCLTEARAALINTSLGYCPSGLCCCPKAVPGYESVCIVPAGLQCGTVNRLYSSVRWYDASSYSQTGRSNGCGYCLVYTVKGYCLVYTVKGVLRHLALLEGCGFLYSKRLLPCLYSKRNAPSSRIAGRVWILIQ